MCLYLWHLNSFMAFKKSFELPSQQSFTEALGVLMVEKRQKDGKDNGKKLLLFLQRFFKCRNTY